MSPRLELLADVLDNQRRLTKWYLKRIPEAQLGDRIEFNGVLLNSPKWIVSHLIWTDFAVGLSPLGYTGAMPEFAAKAGFGSTGDLPDQMPDWPELSQVFDSTHQVKLDYLRSLDDAVLDDAYGLPALGFRNNYYALLHLARHEGVHCGGIALFCKLRGIRTV